MKPSIPRIVELFAYDPIAGTVTLKIWKNNSAPGHVYDSDSIKVDGVEIRITHIIWVLHHGDWPPEGYWIDHKDGVKANNELTNLRLATPTQNQQNKAGYGQYAKGVTWRNRIEKPYQAKIRVNGDRLHLGSFATEEEAAEAYRQAALKYHGEFACLK